MSEDDETGRRGIGDYIPKDELYDIGAAIANWHCKPGVPLTHREIAAFWGTGWQTIWVVEFRALRKIRNLLKYYDKNLGEQLFAVLFERRSCASSRNATEGL